MNKCPRAWGPSGQAIDSPLNRRGVSPKIALVMVTNPEAGKALLENSLKDDQYSVVQTGEGPMGGKTFQTFNKHTGALAPIAAPAGSNNSDGGLGDGSLTGKDYLATLSPRDQNTVLSMSEGRMPPPNSFARAKPYWQQRIAAAQQYDPTFDETQWGTRAAGAKDFGSGKSSEMVRSANQTLGHLSTLVDKMDNLKNGSYPLANYVENAASSATGGGAVTGFNQAANAVADELSKVYKGAGISDAEIKAWKDNLSPNASPAQQREAVSTASELLHHALNALDEKRVSSIGADGG
jgi:hypothetical protein